MSMLPSILAAALLGAATSSLGHGERFDEGRYAFISDLASEKTRDVRALAAYDCRFQSRSWWFNRKSYVVYRHELPSGKFIQARLYLATTVNHKKAYGEIAVEARRPDGEWQPLGALPHHSARFFDLPANVLPAKTLEIRLRGEKSCSLQVARYSLLGETDAADASTHPLAHGVCGVSPGVKVRRRGAIGGVVHDRLVIRTAANEADAGQIVVTPERDVADMRVEVSPLVCAENGAVLPSNAVSIFRVEYVPVSVPSDWKGAVGLWPDPLPPQDGRAFPVKAGDNQPFWVLVKPPKGTKKGVYRGELKVASLSVFLPLAVEVFGFELPDEMTCKTVFGFKPTYSYGRYQRPKTIEERRELRERYLAFLADHHFSPGVLENHASRKEPQQGVLDWTKWDAEIERVIGKYHFNTLRINVSGLGGGNQFRQTEPVFQGVPGTNAEYHVRMGRYLGEIERHLKEKGWLDKAYVYWYDEPKTSDYPFVRKGFETLKRHAPGLKGMLTKQPSKELMGCVDIWCPQPQRLHLEWEAPARARGDVFWWYVCNNPSAPYVGEAIDHPGPEMRMWLWQTWGENVAGILLWRCELWDRDRLSAGTKRLKNPYHDPMTWRTSSEAAPGTLLPTVNGEALLLYPPKACFREDGTLADGPIMEGPVSSIRAEHLRDGIEDYEYFAMLRRLDSSHPLLVVPKDVYSTLESYAEDAETMERHRLALAREIERLWGEKENERKCSSQER